MPSYVRTRIESTQEFGRYRESWLFMNGAFPRIKKAWACVYHCSVRYGAGDMCFSSRKV